MAVAPPSIMDKTEVRTPRTAPISCPFESVMEGTAKKWRTNSYIPSIKCTSMWSPSSFSESDVIRSGYEFGDRSPLFLSTGFRFGSGLLLLFSLLPSGIGVVLLHALGENFGFLTEIFLIHHSIRANDEGHHAGRPVFRGIGHKSESPGHFAVHDVNFPASWGAFPLTRQDLVVVAAVRSRSVISVFSIALSNS